MKTTSQLVIKALVTHRQLAKRLLPFIKSSYFKTYEDRLIFETVKNFIENYGSLPSKDALELVISKRRDISDEQFQTIIERLKLIWEINPTNNLEWLTGVIEEYCREQALFNAISEAAAIISGETKKSIETLPSLLSEALAISFDTSTGTHLDDYKNRYDLYTNDSDRMEFDLKPFNIITRGGVARKSLNLLVAGTGVGKSLAMCSFAVNNVLCARNVLYITGELSEKQITQRLESNLIDIDINEIEDIGKAKYIQLMDHLYSTKLPARLVVKEYPMGATTVFQFHSLLDELRLKDNFAPDVIYVDYLGVFRSARSSSHTGMYEGGKYVAEDLKALAQKYNAAVWSAVQLNRSGWASSDPDLDDTAESFAITHAADLVVMMQQTEELLEESKYECIVRKTRYNSKNSMTRFHVGVDYSRMRLYDVEQDFRPKKEKKKKKRGIPEVENEDVQNSSLRRFGITYRR